MHTITKEKMVELINRANLIYDENGIPSGDYKRFHAIMENLVSIEDDSIEYDPIIVDDFCQAMNIDAIDDAEYYHGKLLFEQKGDWA